MLVKKIFLCGAAERFSAASFWEGGNVDGRKKRRDSKNKRTASGAGQYQGVTGAFGTTGHEPESQVEEHESDTQDISDEPAEPTEEIDSYEMESEDDSTESEGEESEISGEADE